MPKQSSKRTPLKTAAFDDQPLNGAESLCRFAETCFIVANFTNWLLHVHQSCTGCMWRKKICASVLSINTKLNLTEKKKECTVPTTVCSSGLLPANQQKPMCFTLSHLHLVPRHSSHHSSILYLGDLCRSPFYFFPFSFLCCKYIPQHDERCQSLRPGCVICIDVMLLLLYSSRVSFCLTSLVW